MIRFGPPTKVAAVLIGLAGLGLFIAGLTVVDGQVALGLFLSVFGELLGIGVMIMVTYAEFKKERCG